MPPSFSLMTRTWFPRPVVAAATRATYEAIKNRRDGFGEGSSPGCPDKNVHGTYSFVLPDLAPGTIRELRNPDNPEDDDD
jgi:hypothetical protein